MLNTSLRGFTILPPKVIRTMEPATFKTGKRNDLIHLRHRHTQRHTNILGGCSYQESSFLP